METLVSHLLSAILMVWVPGASGEVADPRPVVGFVSPPPAELRGEAAEEVGYLRRHGCRVEALSPERRSLLERAGAHVAEALGDEGFAALLASKRDWPAGADGARSPGERLLEQLRSGALEIVVFAYGRADGHPCDTPLMDGGIHAYTRLGLPFVVIRDDYLGLLAQSDDGARTLAGTLAHELTHALGHEHPNALEAIGSAGYRRTLPVWLGCAARHYPDLDSVRAACDVPLAEPRVAEGTDHPTAP